MKIEGDWHDLSIMYSFYILQSSDTQRHNCHWCCTRHTLSITIHSPFAKASEGFQQTSKKNYTDQATDACRWN
jgi:hypothetical protein